MFRIGERIEAGVRRVLCLFERHDDGVWITDDYEILEGCQYCERPDPKLWEGQGA